MEISGLEDGGLETIGKNAVDFGVAVPQLVAAHREALNKVGRGRHTCLFSSHPMEISGLEDGGLETLGKNAVEFGVAVPQLVAAHREALNKVGRGRQLVFVCPVESSFRLTAASHESSLRHSNSATRTF